MARPKQSEAQDTRQLALDKIEELIHEHGYNGVSMNALAKSVGVRKASLYHHFPEGKEQLVSEMLERMITYHSAGYQQAIADGESAAERLVGIFRFNMNETAGLTSVVVDSMRFLSDEQQAHAGALFMQHQFGRVQAVIEEGIATGELREHDSSLSAWMFLSSMSGLKRVAELSHPDLPEQVVQMFLGGLIRE